MLADSGRMFTRFGGQYLGFELFRGHSYIGAADGAQNRADGQLSCARHFERTHDNVLAGLVQP